MFLSKNMFFYVQKASEEAIPHETETFRPPVDLYPYLGGVGEIYEGEKMGFISLW